MRLALAQLNTTVGDLAGNEAKITTAYQRGVAAGADLVVVPELAVTGYPPRDLLLKMGASTVLCGDIGAGNVTKLANQVIVALNIAAMSEAFVLAAKAGVQPERVFDAIKGGLAGSVVLNAKAPMVLEGNYKPGFRIELHMKDLQNALDTAHEIGVPVPLTSQVMEMMQALKVDGKQAQDHGGLIQFHEKLAGVKVRRGGAK